MSATTYTPNPYQKPWWEVALPGTPGATQQSPGTLGATAQDTGWDYQPGGKMSVDYANPGQATAPPAGSNAFGYSYQNPGAGWDPWGTYEGGNSYRGADGDGLYNVSADTKKGWGPNGQGEFDRDRVWRMTLDAARAEKLDPGAQDPQTQARVKQIYLDEIARLHRDYDNTPGMTWAGSAFSGYDTLAGGAGSQAGTATQQGGTRGQDGQGGGQATAQTGGSNVNPLLQGLGSLAGNGVIQTTGQRVGPGAEGGTPNPTPNPTPTPTPVPTGPQTAGSVVAPMGGYYSANPTAAVTQFLGQHNVGIGDHNPWAEFLRQLATGIAGPIADTIPTDANGHKSLDQLNNLPQMLSNLIYGNGGQAFQNIANYGNSVQQQWTPDKLGAMQAPAVEKLLASIRAFQTLGDNSYMQQFNQQALSDLFSRYQQAVTGAGQSGGKAPNPDWLVGNQQADPFGLFR